MDEKRKIEPTNSSIPDGTNVVIRFFKGLALLYLTGIIYQFMHLVVGLLISVVANLMIFTETDGGDRFFYFLFVVANLVPIFVIGFLVKKLSGFWITLFKDVLGIKKEKVASTEKRKTVFGSEKKSSVPRNVSSECHQSLSDLERPTGGLFSGLFSKK